MKFYEMFVVSYSPLGYTHSTLDEINFSEVENLIKNLHEPYLGIIKRLRDLKQRKIVEQNTVAINEISRQIKELKSRLPCFCLSKFKDNYRKNENFLENPGMILDFDSVENVQELKSKIENDNRTFCCFISPSGDGLKVILLFDESITNADQYKKVYKNYSSEFSKQYGSEADNTADPARACLISYDPKIYINDGCEKISVNVITPIQGNVSKKISNEPILERFVGVEEGKRNTTLTKLIGVCIQKAIQKDVALVIAREWNEQNAIPLEEDEVETTTSQLYNRYYDLIDTFLSYDSVKEKFHFHHYRFKLFLEGLGYFKYRLGNNYVLIREENGIVDLVEEDVLKEDVLNRISDEDKKRYLIEKEKSIFGKSKYDFISTYSKQFNQDTKGEGYVYFKNGYIRVSADSISSVMQWETLLNPIWRSQIIGREFIRINDVDAIKGCEFSRFINNISGQEEKRYFALVTLIGYLCHFFDDPSLKKAGVLYDETPPEEEGQAEGGKGKSIVVQALQHFINNSAWVDGSTLNKITQFTFQQINPDTRLVCIDDLVAKFKFNSMFAAVTEGLTVEKKYRDSFTIKNVKFLITSNFTLAGDGSSFERRLFEVEIAPHYSLRKTPVDDFGHLLFDDWATNEWTLFDNFMGWCIQQYLKNGLVSYPQINVNLKKLITNTSPEFYEYSKTIKLNFEYTTTSEHIVFIHMFCDDKKEITKNTFTRYLKKYAEAKGYEYVIVRGTRNQNNGFKFIKKTNSTGLSGMNKKLKS